jgi:ABC-type uncharacterized transport system substrate-binding protein
MLTARAPGFRRTCYILLLGILSCAAMPGAQASNILLVASSRAALYERFIDTIRDSYRTQDNARFTTIYLDTEKLAATDIDAETDLLLVIGTRAARTVAELKPAIPAIYTLIPESSYRVLVGENTNCNRRSAIYIDQPLQRQALLASHIFPDAYNYGVVLGPVSRQRRAEVDAMRLPPGHELIVRQVEQEENTVTTTRNLLRYADLLLAVNDPLVLNRENAKWLLYAAYQQRIPIIGFSRAYVKAGAAAAVFSEPEQMARQTVELIEKWQDGTGSCLPEPEFTRYFRIAVNKDVCHSLGCNGMDEDILGKKILEQEQLQ